MRIRQLIFTTLIVCPALALAQNDDGPSAQCEIVRIGPAEIEIEFHITKTTAVTPFLEESSDLLAWQRPNGANFARDAVTDNWTLTLETSDVGSYFRVGFEESVVPPPPTTLPPTPPPTEIPTLPPELGLTMTVETGSNLPPSYEPPSPDSSELPTLPAN